MASSTVSYSPLGAQIDRATELADGIVTEAKIAAGAVTVNKLGDNAVETAKIKDAQVTVAKLKDFVNLEYVGSDLVAGSVVNDATETTIGSVAIAADTVSTGVLIMAQIYYDGDAAGGSNFRIKVGAAGSEAEVEKVYLYAYTGVLTEHSVIMFYDTSGTWNADMNVLITAENDAAGASKTAHCSVLMVWGH